MYTKHFGLKKLPFENVPDPIFFFDQGGYSRIRNRITAFLKAGRGLIVVTGPIGSGKTTLSQMIKSDFSNDLKTIWMAEPPKDSVGLFLFISQALGLKPSTPPERVFVLRDIRDALLKINSKGSRCQMIIDESHLMSDDTLDGIRILNNLEEGMTKLIQILLLGQEEMMETINRPEMKPFKQRIAALEILGKMDAEGIRKYIYHRIKVAGGQPSIFTDSGWEAVVLASGTGGGVPRITNSVCDRSLNVAFERKKATVDINDVSEVAEGMGISEDVFHYKIALKRKEQIKQTPSTRRNDLVKKPETPARGPAHLPSKELDRTKNRPSETFQSSRQNKPKSVPFVSEKEQKNLNMPILFFSLSVAALIFSILFYCQRSGSSDLMTCLQGLISFSDYKS